MKPVFILKCDSTPVHFPRF